MLKFNFGHTSEPARNGPGPLRDHESGETKLKEVQQLARNGDSGQAPPLCASALARAEEDFQKLAGKLLNLYDDERRQIARELHDTTAQNLAALSMNLAMLSGVLEDAGGGRTILKECESLTEECLKEVRSLSYMLHPPLLDELGLESAVRSYIAMYGRKTGVAVDLIWQGRVGRLAPEVELAAFRVAQECLINVHRHAGSTKAEVRLAREEGAFEVTVRDWGKGFSADVDSLTSLGIAGMRERVRLFAGQLEIMQANPGTIVRAIFPMG